MSITTYNQFLSELHPEDAGKLRIPQFQDDNPNDLNPESVPQVVLKDFQIKSHDQPIQGVSPPIVTSPLDEPSLSQPQNPIYGPEGPLDGQFVADREREKNGSYLLIGLALLAVLFLSSKSK